MNDEVRLLYSYTLEEQRTFPYVAHYMQGVAPDVPKILLTPHGRERFVLAGLFLTYRACNHMGVSISSAEAANLGSPHRERLAGVELHTGHCVESTAHYLRLLGLSPLRQVLPFFSPARFLLAFVRRADPLVWTAAG